MSTHTGGDLNLVKPELTDDHKVTIGTDLPANFQAIDDAFTTRRVSNKNILHNWDFRNPVNQRGQSSYAGSSINSIDRWRIQANTTLTIEAERVKLNASAAGSHTRQYLEKASRFAGIPITLSFKVKALSASSIRLLVYDSSVDSSSSGGVFSFNDHSFSAGEEKIITHTYTPINGISFIGLQPLPSVDFYLYSAKLELGSISTLANDPATDFGEQLAVCQRYYVRLKGVDANGGIIGSGHAYTTTGIYAIFDLPVPMRAKPSVSASGNIYFVDTTYIASGKLISSIAIHSMTPTKAVCTGIVPSTTNVITAPIGVADATAYIDFSADL